MASHSSLLETQIAATALLKANSAFTSKCAGPFNPPMQNQAFPYAAWGSHIEIPFNVFGPKLGKAVTLILDIYSQEYGFVEALSILDAVNDTFDAETLSLTNFYNVSILFEHALQMNDPDGISRHVVARYKVLNMAL